ncbi:GH10454 [Drosophila grimshawi]|uniref:GH10454 n=1 Tax=Drosophila grimshawi TaxID=7222 RepID=B4JE08_DROGR|nr:GH10454 [Drosophila grimshawi]
MGVNTHKDRSITVLLHQITHKIPERCSIHRCHIALGQLGEHADAKREQAARNDNDTLTSKFEFEFESESESRAACVLACSLPKQAGHVNKRNLDWAG